ncbi:hypothetical protein HK102_007186 [Quaeritorhiza haematococci]|nr:hypothetical protein HK102_007186 [Quaeritorhiza haematococci]
MPVNWRIGLLAILVVAIHAHLAQAAGCVECTDRLEDLAPCNSQCEQRFGGGARCIQTNQTCTSCVYECTLEGLPQAAFFLINGTFVQSANGGVPPTNADGPVQAFVPGGVSGGSTGGSTGGATPTPAIETVNLGGLGLASPSSGGTTSGGASSSSLASGISSTTGGSTGANVPGSPGTPGPLGGPGSSDGIVGNNLVGTVGVSDNVGALGSASGVVAASVGGQLRSALLGGQSSGGPVSINSLSALTLDGGSATNGNSLTGFGERIVVDSGSGGGGGGGNGGSGSTTSVGGVGRKVGGGSSSSPGSEGTDADEGSGGDNSSSTGLLSKSNSVLSAGIAVAGLCALIVGALAVVIVRRRTLAARRDVESSRRGSIRKSEQSQHSAFSFTNSLPRVHTTGSEPHTPVDNNRINTLPHLKRSSTPLSDFSLDIEDIRKLTTQVKKQSLFLGDRLVMDKNCPPIPQTAATTNALSMSPNTCQEHIRAFIHELNRAEEIGNMVNSRWSLSGPPTLSKDLALPVDDDAIATEPHRSDSPTPTSNSPVAVTNSDRTRARVPCIRRFSLCLCICP